MLPLRPQVCLQILWVLQISNNNESCHKKESLPHIGAIGDWRSCYYIVLFSSQTTFRRIDRTFYYNMDWYSYAYPIFNIIVYKKGPTRMEHSISSKYCGFLLFVWARVSYMYIYILWILVILLNETHYNFGWRNGWPPSGKIGWEDLAAICP